MDNSSGVASSEMPRYQCHKEVWALQIASVLEDGLVFVNDRYAPSKIGAEWIAKHQPVAGGYLVVYKDGYQSFSPKEAFEEGYTLIK